MSLDQALGLYNYWIVIFLMMTGFYIVISSQNLIKTIIGLNIFQTSVFLLYITMGKVAGGTAPIIQGGHGDHGHGHDQSHDANHSHHVVDHVDSGQLQTGSESFGEKANAELGMGHEHDHSATMQEVAAGQTAETGELIQEAGEVVGYADNDAAAVAGELLPTGPVETIEKIYSNPLPSVLMLTAIVVGIATTALALALIVRIREEYGTIEEDEILELDKAA
ncbi:MAG: cation:proton antiporter subunit C [Planctomycetota bacterium]